MPATGPNILPYSTPTTRAFRPWRWTAMAGTIGLVSGLGAATIFTWDLLYGPRDFNLYLRFWVPGLFFGMAVFLPHLIAGRISWRWLWVALPVSIAAFAAASLFLARYIDLAWLDDPHFITLATLAGGLASAVVGLAFIPILRLPSGRGLLFIAAGTLASAVFGLLAVYWRRGNYTDWAETAAMSFMLYQCVTAMTLTPKGLERLSLSQRCLIFSTPVATPPRR